MHARLKKHRFAAMALIGCGALFAATACGTDAAETTGTVDLTMAVWTTNEKQLSVFNEIAEAYVSTHADTVRSIKFQPLSGTYLTTLTTQIAGGDTPDMAWIPEANAQEFGINGVLYNLRPTFDSSKDFDLADVVPSALELWKNDNEIYAYPFSTSPFGIYVNRALVDAAGQRQPADLLASGQWTWDKAAEVAAATATKTPGTGPIVIGTAPHAQWDGLTPVWSGWGAAPWTADGGTCTFNSSEMVDAISWYHDKMYKGRSFAKPGEKFSFGSGGAAMLVGQMSAAGAIDASLDWDFLPLPAGPDGQVDVIGQAAIGVIAKSDTPEIAAEFLTYFTNASNSAKLAQFFPAPRASLLTVDVLQQAAPSLSPEQIQQSIIDAIPNAVTKANNSVYSQITQTIQSKLDALWSPNADVKTALDEVCTAIEPQLAASKK